jgi:hypothetical protein
MKNINASLRWSREKPWRPAISWLRGGKPAYAKASAGKTPRPRHPAFELAGERRGGES